MSLFTLSKRLTTAPSSTALYDSTGAAPLGDNDWWIITRRRTVKRQPPQLRCATRNLGSLLGPGTCLSTGGGGRCGGPTTPPKTKKKFSSGEK